MKLRSVLVLFVVKLTTMSAPAAELVVVAKGRMEAAVAVAEKWKANDNYIESTGAHYLFAEKGIGQGDFQIRARLSLDAFNGSAAAFVLGNNKFGFEGKHRRMYVQGPNFPDGKTIAKPGDFITPKRPFDLLVARRNNNLTFYIDNKKVWDTPFDVEEITSIGLRPWRARMQIYEFTIDGNLIESSLPELTASSVTTARQMILSQKQQLQASAGTDKFEQALLATTPEQSARLAVAKQAGVLEIAPVHLPTNPKGDNNHFGWPVATMLDDTIIVVHRSMPGHNRNLSGKADENTTYSTIIRSSDGGQTWSEPYDVRDCMKVEDRNRGGAVPLSHRYKFDPANESPLGYKLHLNAIGITRDGGVILVSDHGVFRSEDKGQTWRHLRLAFREDRHDGPFVYVGPRIIDDSKHGLLLFAHHTIYRSCRPVDIARELAVYRSRDGGESWEKTSLALPDWCKPAEPDVIFHEGQFTAIVRNQAPANVLAQMRFKWGEAVISDVANTRMKTRVSVDTSAICFNPVTRRFEVVQSKREDMSIHLFSIASEDWKLSKWRHEGCLFKRAAGFYSTADGFHTGGAVLDEKRGVQHVFFYSGHPGGPAGVFRMTRTLETPNLAKLLEQ